MGATPDYKLTSDDKTWKWKGVQEFSRDRIQPILHVKRHKSGKLLYRTRVGGYKKINTIKIVHPANDLERKGPTITLNGNFVINTLGTEDGGQPHYRAEMFNILETLLRKTFFKSVTYGWMENILKSAEVEMFHPTITVDGSETKPGDLTEKENIAQERMLFSSLLTGHVLIKNLEIEIGGSMDSLYELFTYKTLESMEREITKLNTKKRDFLNNLLPQRIKQPPEGPNQLSGLKAPTEGPN